MGLNIRTYLILSSVKWLSIVGGDIDFYIEWIYPTNYQERESDNKD